MKMTDNEENSRKTWAEEWKQVVHSRLGKFIALGSSFILGAYVGREPKRGDIDSRILAQEITQGLVVDLEKSIASGELDEYQAKVYAEIRQSLLADPEKAARFTQRLVNEGLQKSKNPSCER